MRVIDVSCGTGDAALLRRVAAHVTGLDLAARLLEAGRAKARVEGLEIEWREGDVSVPTRGAIVTATWTPEGVFGDLSKASAIVPA